MAMNRKWAKCALRFLPRNQQRDRAEPLPSLLVLMLLLPLGALRPMPNEVDELVLVLRKNDRPTQRMLIDREEKRAGAKVRRPVAEGEGAQVARGEREGSASQRGGSLPLSGSDLRERKRVADELDAAGGLLLLSAPWRRGLFLSSRRVGLRRERGGDERGWR